ncbi:hypothetical protein K1719_023402 [Acacia pycnantha]|nr:hypothetical protein K1719_023402 [Acacia pycnantha]
MATSSLISATFFIFLLHLATSIGINYGTLGDNLPSPQAVENFLKTKTTINSVKIFDVSPQILQAFAGSGISVTITAPNGDILALTNLDSTRQWVVAHIKPFHPQTKIKYILVGSKVLHGTDWNIIKLLIPVMRTLHRALNAEGIRDIKVFKISSRVRGVSSGGFGGSGEHLDDLLEGGSIGLDEGGGIRVFGFGSGNGFGRVNAIVVVVVVAAGSGATVGAEATRGRKERRRVWNLCVVMAWGNGSHR